MSKAEITASSVNENEPAKKKKTRNPFNNEQIKIDRDKRRKKRARIIIRNISYKTTDETLRKHFEKHGTILDLNLLKRPDGKLVGCAFIQYDTVNQAAKAILKANKKPFLGREIYVDWALGKNEYDKKKLSDNHDNLKNIVKEEDIKSEIESDDNEDIEDVSVKDEENSSNDDDEDRKETKVKIELNVDEKKKNNDAEDGCTIFIKNVPLDATNNDLFKVCRKYGKLKYAIVNTDPISKYSKGTAFVRFKTKQSADLCLNTSEEFILMDTVLQPFPALSRQQIKNKDAKDSSATDSRNLYLVKEGLIMTGSKAADGVSAADIAKRHKLEQVKASVLKDLNRFVSRNRLSIHNLPLNYDDDKLKSLIIQHTQFKPHECRVMRENKPSPGYPKGKSKGFGFMSFSTHMDALSALRKLNNNPKVFGPTSRPIVSFSIEDRSVHNIKEKRLQKSRDNNPTYKTKLEKMKMLKKLKSERKRKEISSQANDKTQIKKMNSKKLLNRKHSHNKINDEETINGNDFVGMPAKHGTFIKMRSQKKIREQATEHKKKLSEIKRKDKQRKERRMHKMERKEIDRTKIGKKKTEKDNFSILVNKYKNLVDARGESQNKLNKKPKSKWYVD